MSRLSQPTKGSPWAIFDARSSTPGSRVAAIASAIVAEPVRAMMPSPCHEESQRGTCESSARSSRNSDQCSCSAR